MAIYTPDIDYKVVHLKQVHEIYKVADLHDDKTIVAIIPDVTDVQKINVCFHTLHDLHRDKPVIMLLELLTVQGKVIQPYTCLYWPVEALYTIY